MYESVTLFSQRRGAFQLFKYHLKIIIKAKTCQSVHMDDKPYWIKAMYVFVFHL